MTDSHVILRIQVASRDVV